MKDLDGKYARLPLIIVKGNQPSLLGRDWLEKLQLVWREKGDLFFWAVFPWCIVIKLFRLVPGWTRGTSRNRHIHRSWFRCKTTVLPGKTATIHFTSSVGGRTRQVGVTWHYWTCETFWLGNPYRFCYEVQQIGAHLWWLQTYSEQGIAPGALIHFLQQKKMFLKLAGGKKFTELDLGHAYEQTTLGWASQDMVTINTHRGLFRYKNFHMGFRQRQPFSRGP